MSDTLKFVEDSLSGNAVEASDTFVKLMQDAIAGKIEAARPTVAASLLNPNASDTDDTSTE